MKAFKYQISKEYRSDLNQWEEKIIIFWFIPYYRYLIWRDGDVQIEKTFFVKSNKTKKYLKGATVFPNKVNADDLKNDYSNNKYLVPLNKELDL